MKNNSYIFYQFHLHKSRLTRDVKFLANPEGIAPPNQLYAIM